MRSWEEGNHDIIKFNLSVGIDDEEIIDSLRQALLTG